MATQEERTDRLTVLIDPRKKAAFERLCSAEDMTPSQVVRRMIREYVESRIGTSWHDEPDVPVATRAARR